MLVESTNSKYCFRQPGRTAPALALSQSYWALTQREIPISDSLETACKEGYEYFEAGLSEDRLSEIEALLKRFPLKLIAQGWANTIAETIPFMRRAVSLGAVAFNLHLGHAFLSAAEAAALAAEAQAHASALGLPLLLETHRGRMTQDLFRTSELVRHNPSINITLDVSHYIVASESLGGDEALFRKHMEPLLERTGLIHGRISNGQSAQVLAEAPLAFTEVTQSFWREAMQLWSRNAPSDAVLVFTPELGPPPYAYLLRDGAETFSRTNETHTLVELARQAWAQAMATEQSI